MPEARDAVQLLRTLARHEGEFILIGGLAAVLRGAPVVTYDVDVVHARNPDNVERLLQACTELEDYYRQHPERKPIPEAKWLLRGGHHLLATRFGPLDVLGELTEGRDYEGLLPESDQVPLAQDFTIRVLRLEILIELKRELARDKDKLALPVLIATLNEQRKLNGS
jgi:hypothetical protein